MKYKVGDIVIGVRNEGKWLGANNIKNKIGIVKDAGLYLLDVYFVSLDKREIISSFYVKPISSLVLKKLLKG